MQDGSHALSTCIRPLSHILEYQLNDRLVFKIEYKTNAHTCCMARSVLGWTVTKSKDLVTIDQESCWMGSEATTKSLDSCCTVVVLLQSLKMSWLNAWAPLLSAFLVTPVTGWMVHLLDILYDLRQRLYTSEADQEPACHQVKVAHLPFAELLIHRIPVELAS